MERWATRLVVYIGFRSLYLYNEFGSDDIFVWVTFISVQCEVIGFDGWVNESSVLGLRKVYA